MTETIDREDVEFQPARFEVALGLPPAEDRLLAEAANSVRQEFRESSRWKRLRCRKLSIFAERDRGTIYAVQVGESVEFDWTWEGAKAFRPRSMRDDDSQSASDLIESLAYEDETLWSGEIVEVDEPNGYLFISLDNPEKAPLVGSFFVRPFEFLAVIDSVYNDAQFDQIQKLLPARLAATQGNVHPPAVHSPVTQSQPMAQCWQHSWEVLWGPPGTGKTYTTGQQIAAILDDPTERILVVSTTNRATDAVALSIGNAARRRSLSQLEDGQLLRLGKGAAVKQFEATGFEVMLRGTESETLAKIDGLAHRLAACDSWEEKALTRKQMGELRSQCSDHSQRLFVDAAVKVIATTSFKAMLYLDDPAVKADIEKGFAPFTTIFIDEAGLISRTTVAALTLLAAQRVILVGDSKQLAPISRNSRILPTQQQTWLASSGLSHLDALDVVPKAVHVLSEQRRMHPDVCTVVSKFQYSGLLSTAQETKTRSSSLCSFIADYSRTIWYVLDHESSDLATARAQRGPGNRSWIRAITVGVMEKLLEDHRVKHANGLFISPFRAQAVALSKWFKQIQATSWEASTVHSQQGAEADLVVFDTVNAGSYNWPFEEWKRLINVALSRAREAIIVLASSSEMEEPYLRPLTKLLVPSRLIRDATGLRWERCSTGPLARQYVKSAPVVESSVEYVQPKKSSLGSQFVSRKELKPVLTHEQQRLTNIKLDGKPRLVRGVAGSGKSMVLCNWLAKTAQRFQASPELRIWAVYANRSLHKLLRESVESAWQDLHSECELFDPPEFPWNKVSLFHVKDMLAGILPSVDLSMDAFEFDYDRAAEEFLNRQDASSMLPRCTALFIDEAQDMGPATLKLLLSIVERSDSDDPNSRSAHIFYDNEQNIYDRKTPNWTELGIDLRGRSTVMRESFRSTIPITELAINVLHRLAPQQCHDHTELLRLGLIEKSNRSGQSWLKVRFTEVDGPLPKLVLLDNRMAEMEALSDHLKYLMQVEGVSASDITLIYNNQWVAELISSTIAPRLQGIGVELSVQKRQSFERRENTLLVTTTHSYKGHESEVVVLPCIDQFITTDGVILANNLYVAMTRARSLLTLFGIRGGSSGSKQLVEVIQRCTELLNWTPQVDLHSSIQEDINDILQRIGRQHRQWLVDLWKQFEIRQEPLFGPKGEVVAEPVFWFTAQGWTLACFGQEQPPSNVLGQLEKLKVRSIHAGTDVELRLKMD